MKTTQTTVTFRSVVKSRGCAEFGPAHMVYTDTVREDGTVLWSVKGTSDGAYVNETGERVSELALPLDFSAIRKARTQAGWIEAA